MGAHMNKDEKANGEEATPERQEGSVPEQKGPSSSKPGKERASSQAAPGAKKLDKTSDEKAEVKKPEVKAPLRRFVLSSSPHVRDPETMPRIMSAVILTLIPATLGATWIFGFRALVLVLIGMAAAALTEVILQKLFRLPVTVADGSALVTGLLVSFNIAPGTPWWIPVLGSFFAIAVVKMPFGGLGYNPLNPALAGRAFLLASWPLHMTKDWLPPFWWKLEGYSFFAWKVDPSKFMVDGVSFATPLEIRKNALKTVLNPEGVPHELVARALTELHQTGDRLMNLWVGTVGGCIGETSVILLLIGAAYLLYKNYIDWRTPISYIAVVALGGWMFGGVGGMFQGDALFHIFAGGLILGAFYMATDMVTTPITKKGHLIFGIGCGILTIFIRLVGGYPEGVSYSILLMNLFTPLIDRWTVPRRFGHTSDLVH